MSCHNRRLREALGRHGASAAAHTRARAAQRHPARGQAAADPRAPLAQTATNTRCRRSIIDKCRSAQSLAHHRLRDDAHGGGSSARPRRRRRVSRRHPRHRHHQPPGRAAQVHAHADGDHAAQGAPRRADAVHRAAAASTGDSRRRRHARGRSGGGAAARRPRRRHPASHRDGGGRGGGAPRRAHARLRGRDRHAQGGERRAVGVARRARAQAHQARGDARHPGGRTARRLLLLERRADDARRHPRRPGHVHAKVSRRRSVHRPLCGHARRRAHLLARRRRAAAHRRRAARRARQVRRARALRRGAPHRALATGGRAPRRRHRLQPDARAAECGARVPTRPQGDARREHSMLPAAGAEGLLLTRVLRGRGDGARAGRVASGARHPQGDARRRRARR